MIEKEQFENWHYREEKVLRYLYHQKRWDQSEIADEFGTTKSTISRWMSMFDIETEYRTIDKLGEDEVRRLYWKEGKTQEEIGEMVGSNQENVSRYMKEHGIETRDSSNTPATFYTDDNGYEYWYTKPDSTRYPVHRLLIVAEYGGGVLDGKEVHHKNQIPWDNRMENIELLTPSEHGRVHHA